MNPGIGGACQHNSVPVPSPDKWGGKPEHQPNIYLKRGFYLLLFPSSYYYLIFFVLIYARSPTIVTTLHNSGTSLDQDVLRI